MTHIPKVAIEQRSSHNRVVAMLLAIFLGYLGVHRLYVGRYFTAVIWFFTWGLFGFGWFYDVVMLALGRFRDSEDRVLGPPQLENARPQYQALPEPPAKADPLGEIDFSDVEKDPLEEKFAELEQEISVRR